MLFNHNDLSGIENQLEYVDTVIIPVVDVQFERQLYDNVDRFEILQYVTMMAESQFKGRLLLMPPVQITNDSTTINEMNAQLLAFGFKNIINVCAATSQLDTTFPTYKVDIFPVSSMDEHMRSEMLQKHVTGLMKKVIEIWNK